MSKAKFINALQTRVRALEKLETEITSHLASGSPEARRIRSFKGNLEMQRDDILKKYEEYGKFLEDNEGDALYDMLEERAEVNEKIIDLLSQLEVHLNGSGGGKVVTASNSRNNDHLPTINLRTFDGNLTEWKPFWDNFSTLIDDLPDCPPVKKMHYLVGQLRGHPKTMAENYKITHENYPALVQSLKNKYGNEVAIKDALMLQFVTLSPPQHCYTDLIKFQTEVESLMNNLTHLKCEMKGGEWVFVNCFRVRLKVDTIEMIQNRSKSDARTWTDFKDGLQKTVEYLQKKESTNQAMFGNIKESYKKDTKLPKEDIGAYSVSADTRSKPKTANMQGASTFSRKNDSPRYSRTMKNCIMCEGNHIHYQCTSYKTVDERLKRTSELGRCTRCFGVHLQAHCKVNLYTCKKCNKGQHHSFFCRRNESAAQSDNVTTSVCSVETLYNPYVTTALPTAEVTVIGKGCHNKVRALFDQGSQKSFIHAELVRTMQLKNVREVELTIRGFNGTVSASHKVVRPKVRMGGAYHTIEAIVVDDMPSPIQTNGIAEAVKQLKKQGVRLADPNIDNDKVEDIKVLIGCDYYNKYVTSITTQADIKLLKCHGGHMIFGNLPEKYLTETVNPTNAVMVARIGVTHNPVQSELDSEDETNVHKIWDLDSIGIQRESHTPEETSAYENYHQSVTYQDQQYWVRLPWKVNKPDLPTNFQVAMKRLKCTIHKLRKTENHLEMYDQIISDQLEKGFIEKVPDAQVNPATHYLPHLAVIKDSKTTPVRIVFDCSAKQDKSSFSLNECLFPGPSLTEKLGKILLKMRTNPVAFAADISKAFLRVGLQEEDRDYTRFLWPENPHDPHSKLITYRFRAVLFGATSSPFLLQATLTHHLDKSKSPYAEKIKESLYVDNLQGTVLSEEELLKFYDSANKTMAEANMPLQEWCTNSPMLQNVLHQQAEGQQYKIKLLGINWNVKKDQLSVKDVSFDNKPLTKRTLLSNISKLYDPLGLMSPMTIPSKILMQETWKLKIDWDEVLPLDIQKKWEDIKLNFVDFSLLSFPRETCREDKQYELHVFCDASSKAYGAVAYVTDGLEIPSLLTSKAKVAPVKAKTLPQLELTAVYVGVHLQDYIVRTLSNITFKEIFMWSDSEVALQWVRNNSGKNVYVRNRVAQINDVGSHCIFQHVTTDQNPADFLTRGQSVSKLAENQLWRNGPQWLNHKEDWPHQKPHVAIQCQVTEVVVQKQISSPIDGSKYSK